MIEQDQAIKIAREQDIAKDWAFIEPLKVVIRYSWFGGISRYEVERVQGTKARFVIDAKTGGIISEGYVSR